MHFSMDQLAQIFALLLVQLLALLLVVLQAFADMLVLMVPFAQALDHPLIWLVALLGGVLHF